MGDAAEDGEDDEDDDEDDEEDEEPVVDDDRERAMLSTGVSTTTVAQSVTRAGRQPHGHYLNPVVILDRSVVAWQRQLPRGRGTLLVSLLGHRACPPRGPVTGCRSAPRPKGLWIPPPPSRAYPASTPALAPGLWPAGSGGWTPSLALALPPWMRRARSTGPCRTARSCSSAASSPREPMLRLLRAACSQCSGA